VRLAEAHERDEMLILAAQVGLTPDQFYDLSYREFECVLEGYQRQVDLWMDLAAWAQANLINVHITKGKKVKAADLRGKRAAVRNGTDDRSDEEIMAELDIATGGDPRDRMRARMKAAAAKAEREESQRYMSSPAGQKLRKMVERMYS